MPSFTTTVVALLVTILSVSHVDAAKQIRFEEASDRVGFPGNVLREADKFGGPMIADFNGDGMDDLALCNHNAELQIFHHVDGGTFEPVKGIEKKDWHGISANDLNGDGEMDLLISIGGNNGLVPKAPVVFLYNTTEKEYNEMDENVYGLNKAKGRGRSTRFIDMDLDGDQDILVNNRANNGNLTTRKSVNWIYENLGGGRYRYFEVPFTVRKAPCQGTALVTDFNDDQKLDLVCLSEKSISMLKGTGQFPKPFEDVSSVWGVDLERGTDFVFYTSATELDYDNDGRMDIYLTCGGNPLFEDRLECNDVLLRNTGSSFVDVSERAGLPIGGIHREPAAGDFNLDGYIDLYIPNFGTGPNIILANNGDGTFTTSLDHGANPGKGAQFGAAGAGALVTRTGRELLDLVVGYEPGAWRFFRNKSLVAEHNTLTLTLSDRPDEVPRGAKVTVKTGDLTMVRRIGSSGETHQSYSKTAHFGLGTRSKADVVRVDFVGGKTVTRYDVRAGRNFLRDR